MSDKDSAMVELINRSIRFTEWAAGEGITPADESLRLDPAEILMEYSAATVDEDWRNIGNRISAYFEEMASAYQEQKLEIARLREARDLIANWIIEGTEDLPDDTPVTIKIGSRSIICDELKNLRAAAALKEADA